MFNVSNEEVLLVFKKLTGIKSRVNPFFSGKSGKLHKVIAGIVVIALVAGIIITFNPFTTSRVSAGEYREGFLLSPLSQDSTGVQPGSSFTLKSQIPIMLDDLKQDLTIDGEPVPLIEKLNDESFLITPTNPLEQNKLYTFCLRRNELSTIKWTFQTSAPFDIVGNFPANAATGVPVNSGIEIYLSHEEYDDIDNFFEITPKVEGSFERHKRAAVFVPKELKPDTLYTVKIKKGLALKGTDYSLTEDYTFMFETQESSNNDRAKGYFNYNQLISEFSTTDTPLLPFNFYVNERLLTLEPESGMDSYDSSYARDLAAGISSGNTENSNIIEVETSVYNYKDVDSFVEALTKRSEIPPWAYVSYQKNKTETKDLTKVLDFKQQFETRPREQQYIMIPQTLPEGFYIVESNWEDITFQTFVEITDIGMYIMNSEDDILVWLNFISTGNPVEGAKIEPFGENKSYTSDNEGIVLFDNSSFEAGNDTNYIKFFKVHTGDKVAVFYLYMRNYIPYKEYNNQNNYWSILETDRNLYKPDDTVNLWGFLKPRYSSEKIDSVTVEISQGYYRPMFQVVGLRWLPTANQPFVSKTVNLENGVFHGQLKLPSLEPGGYQLVVKRGSEIIAQRYLSVENYIKPLYKIDITKDKEAILADEEVTFTIKASFFEGTPVPGLNVEYNIYTGIGTPRISGNVTTDDQGIVTVKYTAKPSGDVQGENYASIYVRSTLPEMGDISGHNQVRIFVNDINVKFETEYKDNNGKISATVNEIILDRINDGTAEKNSDYLGNTVQGKELKGTLYKNTWIKIEDGEYYDFINKVTQKRYRHELKEEAIQNFSITTDEDGKGTFEFFAEQPESGFYSANLNCTDGNNRNMKFNVHIGNYYYWNDYDNNSYSLHGAEDKYKMGEEVLLTFKKGEEALKSGRFLFVKSQNGIKEYEISDSPVFSFNIQDKDIPNVYVSAVCFNGINHIKVRDVNIRYDYDEKNLILKLEKDKETYKPGEEVTIKITAADKDGNPQKATVNASIVDEALLKLSNKFTNVLADLYSYVPSGIQTTYCSHQNSGQNISSDIAKSAAPAMGGANLNGGNMAMSMDSMELASVAREGSTYESDSDYIRSDFRDTAYFKTITLDESGYGELKFKLPDNVTSWRVTLAGVSENLLAGSDLYELNVSLPFFTNYTMNTTYLAGDVPVLGVNAYGNELMDGEKVYFKVTGGGNTFLVEGKAFERVNIPLWELDEGLDQEITITASSDKYSDSLKHVFDVVKSYHVIDRAEIYSLEPHIDFEGGKTGNTTLIFTDKSRGAFLPELTSLLYSSGNRVDQKLSGLVAFQMIKKYFKQDEIKTPDASFKVTDYQTSDGGIAILPYGSSEPDVSAKIVSLAKDDVNNHNLKQYFYSLLYGDSPGIKGNALYGLAVLKEPVLLELDKAAGVSNADMKDIIYIALAYCELGETPKAEQLYENVISKKIESMKPFYRINTGKDQDDILDSTALAAYLASILEKDEKEGLYGYAVRNATKDILVNIEKLLYVQNEIEKSKSEDVEFTYTLNGQEFTQILKDGETFTLTIPSANLNKFDVTDVKGSVAMISMFKDDKVTKDTLSKDISVTRTYYSFNGEKTNNFKQNDIVKVVLNWDIKETAIDGGYEITDYLPSGLKPIDNPHKIGVEKGTQLWFRNIDGQKVTFYAWKNTKNKEPFTYYARVISPGTYTADAPIMQSTASTEVINIGEACTIVIE